MAAHWLGRENPGLGLNGEPMTTFAATGLNDLAAVVGTHSGSETRSTFLFAVSTAKGSLSHDPFSKKKTQSLIISLHLPLSQVN